jgi:hypothetical protein
MAAAASTLLYKSHYGGGGGDNEDNDCESEALYKGEKRPGKVGMSIARKRAGSEVESEEDADVVEGILALSQSSTKSGEKDDDYSSTKSGEKDDEKDDDYIPDGLVFSDDDDCLIDVDSESEDERLRSSFPKDKPRRNLLPGGPQPPDLTMFPESERDAVWAKYKKARKKYADDERQKRLKKQRAYVGVSGDQSEQLRPMTEVEKYRLSEGQIFKNKDILQLRIGEEANLRGICIRVARSDNSNLTVVGLDFYVHASVYENSGWHVHQAICREGDDYFKIPSKDIVDPEIVVAKKGYLRIPIKAKFLVAIIKNAVSENPGITYQSIREIMKPYAKEYTLTESILQDGRDLAKMVLFGDADDNVKYADGVLNHLRALGHEVEMFFNDRRSTLQMVSTAVLYEENMRRKKDKLPALNKAMQKSYLTKWKALNELWLNTVFGLADGPQLRFLTGVLVATASSKSMVPFLQEVIQADGAHSSFGKYTLFSAYASTANGNMAPLAFGLLFGNEDTNNWSKFWSFVMKVHPSINSKSVTILTDQDKGSIAAVASEVPDAAQFHCSFHRRQNIVKTLGGGKGYAPLTGLWLYNLLAGCHSMAQLERTKAKYYPDMSPTALHYLQKVDDTHQYPAARCAMGDNICMYGKSASSGVESMNRANSIARERTAVDVLNAVILLIKLEGSRYDFYQHKAWSREEYLTNRGMDLMEEAFRDVSVRDYRISITECNTFHRITVSHMTSANEYIVTIPMQERMGSRYGRCTCGKPNTDGIPCKHMVVVAKSSKIEGLTRMDIMPYWWTTAQWRQQYALEVNCPTDITLNTVKSSTTADDMLRYCPGWVAARKKGRPKANVREKSVVDLIQESAKKKKRTRKVKMYCSICQKWNHNTVDCYHNSANKKTTLKEEGGKEGGGESDEGTHKEGEVGMA